MSLTFKTGDLFLDKAEALVNTVNCVGVMGKGVAYQFKHRWVDNYKAYKKACNAKELRPGRMLVFEVTNLFGQDSPKFIVNFPTKDHWRAKSKLEYISDGLDALVEAINKYKIKSIALPPLGCGNGGLDWNIVRPMMTERLSKLEGVDVSIYVPRDEVDEPEHIETGLKMTTGRAVLLKALASLESHFGVLDRLSIQKIAYLLQVLGIQLNLDFSKNLYGPYSEALKRAVVALEEHKLIAGFQADREAHITKAGYAAAEDFLKTDEHSEIIINSLVRLVDGFETPYGLELLTTVHKLSTSGGKEKRNFDDIAAVMLHSERNKRNVFDAEEIRLAFARLKEDLVL